MSNHLASCFCFLGERRGIHQKSFLYSKLCKVHLLHLLVLGLPPLPLMGHWLVVCLPLILSGSPPRVASHDIDSCLSVFAFSPAHIRRLTISCLQSSGSSQSTRARFGAFLYRSWLMGSSLGRCRRKKSASSPSFMSPIALSSPESSEGPLSPVVQVGRASCRWCTHNRSCRRSHEMSEDKGRTAHTSNRSASSC